MFVLLQVPLFWHGLSMSHGTDEVLQFAPMVFWPWQVGATNGKCEAFARNERNSWMSRLNRLNKPIARDSVDEIGVESLENESDLVVVSVIDVVSSSRRKRDLFDDHMLSN